MIAIDKNIPLPAGPMPRDVYPFKALAVSDSFAFPTHVTPEQAYKAGTNATRRLKPKRFIVRKTATEIRCWRVA